MHLTMVKKRLADGSECRKCVEASAHLKSRELWDRVDEVVWAVEDDPESAGMRLAAAHSLWQAPFFIVRDGADERLYTSVLQLIRQELGQAVTVQERVRDLDPDDIGI